jgi:hypothetical protein
MDQEDCTDSDPVSGAGSASVMALHKDDVNEGFMFLRKN